MMGVSGWMFLLVPAYPGSPVKQLCVCVLYPVANGAFLSLCLYPHCRVYIYNFIRHRPIGSHKTLNNYREKQKEKNRQISHSQHSGNIRRDIRLHLTDRPIYLNSLQSPFLDAKYFCIKLCRLFSATCWTDWQLNNCIHAAMVSRDSTKNILLKQLSTAKSRELCLVV